MSKIIGEQLSNIPWQEKPANTNSPVWRYSANPIINRDAIPNSNSVFNSAVVPFEGGFAGVFRCDSKSVSMDIFAGFSDDGVNWKINHEPIVFEGDEEIIKREYRYDPRVIKIEDRYYITWCNGYHGPTIGIAYTFDFKTFHQLENAFCLTTVMVYFSHVKSMIIMLWSAVQVTRATLLSETFSTV